MQVDVGAGDAVLPPPEWLEYPSLLDLPRPRLQAYRPETVIAEKVHAMVLLGTTNSRMRDFFDVFLLAKTGRIESDTLAQAIKSTFERRRTNIPEALPLSLTPAFAASREKQVQWQAFLNKNGLTTAPADFGKVVQNLADFLSPIFIIARGVTLQPLRWNPAVPWEGKRRL